MRLPGTKIYRAFPELDRFNDERCARFVRAASWNGGWVIVRWIGLTVVYGLAMTICAVVLGVLSDLMPRFMGGDWWMLPAAVGLFTWFLVPALATMLARDALLRRRVRLFIGARGTCACGYVLLGLPVSAGLIVICPECGADTKVDVALGELVTDGDGARRFKPAEGGGL